MACTIRPLTEADTPAMVEMFNYYLLHTFQAFPSTKCDASVYQRFKQAAGDFPFYAIDDPEGTFIGFALLRPLRPADTMRHVAEITIFLAQGTTHKGVGSEILKRLEDDARKLGITILMANASSRNEASLGFQRRNGFVECERFKSVVHKFGEVFDMVWMQKFL
jgi:L-amino acid N-acyltransferase YncA